MLALPRELDSAQRAELVRGYAEDITEGRAPWLAAFHEKGKDQANPHCHLVLRDRDFETNRRVIGTSEKGSTERLRQKWEEHANRALERAGHRERIDRRTLKAQGLEREPTIHEGPQAQAMDKRGVRPTSRRRNLRNRPGSRDSHRTVDYRSIDRGVSRPQVNRAIRQGRQDSEKDLWEAVDRDTVKREQQALRDIHRPPDGDKVVRFPKVAQRAGEAPRLSPRAKEAVPKEARWAEGDKGERPPLERPVNRSQRDRVKNETAEPSAKEKRPSLSERLRQERLQSRPPSLDRQSEQNDQPKEKRSFSKWLRSPEAKNTKALPAKERSRDRDNERER